MTEHDMSVEPAVGTHGSLKIDPVALPERSELGLLECHGHHIERERMCGKSSGGETCSRDGDAASLPHITERLRATHHEFVAPE